MVMCVTDIRVAQGERHWYPRHHRQTAYYYYYHHHQPVVPPAEQVLDIVVYPGGTTIWPTTSSRT